MQYQASLVSLLQNAIVRDLFPDSFGHLHSNAAHVPKDNPKTDRKSIEKADNYMQYSHYSIKYSHNLPVPEGKGIHTHPLAVPNGKTS